MITIRKLLNGLVVLSVFAILLGGMTGARAANDPAKIAGPNACAECHKNEAAVWKGTHHFKTFRDLPRN